ncbi:TrmH family RNA methyltransferase [Mangrovimonas spongiae]|uniref:tRNA (guanosine(18)-2'-O)-methyltransferase n=1 Tax=Mangrovimonas spongiae TaxID=2494697 RepID=A0A428K252_9FLAO|nr:RNA methyltransferase [Mangrovimonas spongiae]RSK40455.1 TrmH family RNA methyltransferase [Mangrovimonas spongiae]
MIDIKLLEYLESYLTDNRKQRFSDVLKERTRHFTVATEDVYHLHNTSAVIRSCDVFGIQDVHVIEEKRTKRIESEIALGAQKWVDIHRHKSTDNCIDSLRDKGYQIVATTPHTKDCVLQDFDITKKSCFFFGKEVNGLSDTVMEQADGFLKIPMVGFTESLNISVSAAIILQYVTSQLKQTSLPWMLTEDELLEKRLDWTKKSLKNYDTLLKHFYNNQ